MKVAFINHEDGEVLKENLGVSPGHCLLLLSMRNFEHRHKVRLPTLEGWYHIVEVVLDYAPEHGPAGKLTLFVELID